MTTNTPPTYYFTSIDFNSSFYTPITNQTYFDSRYLLKNYQDTATEVETFNAGLISNGTATINGVLQCQGLTSGSSTNGLSNIIYGTLQLANSSSGILTGNIQIPDNSVNSNCCIHATATTSGINMNGAAVNICSSSLLRLSVSANQVSLSSSTLVINSTNTGISYQPNTITSATYTLAVAGAFLIFNANSNSIIVTIPSSGLVTGQKYKILINNASVNTVSLSPASTVSLNSYSGGVLTTITNPSSLTLSNNSMYELFNQNATTYTIIKISD